jgi:hypothetical protein
MPIINVDYEFNKNMVVILRLFSGLVWLMTVIRRLFTPNYSNFEERITTMAEGTTIFPSALMDIAVTNWFFIFLIILCLEIISSLSLLSGFLARGGALIATVNGIAIGMAGVGLGIGDLLIPWSVAMVTLFLLLFTHPGKYKGIDSYLIERKIPKWVKPLI